jgi:anti-anti-sigma regulatory factor
MLGENHEDRRLLRNVFVPKTIEVQIRETSTSIDVQVDGAITSHTADRLSRRLHSAVSLAADRGRLTVDLTGVVSIDTTGATVLRDAQMSAFLSQVAMTIVGEPPRTASDPAPAENSFGLPARRRSLRPVVSRWLDDSPTDRRGARR